VYPDSVGWVRAHMSPTALVAEDEAPQRRELCRMLASRWPELQIVAECPDGSAAIAALHAHRPTVAFLDIRMAGATGLEVARQACNMAHVVFTTAYEQHAIEAFEVEAVDYLLKPVTVERLDRTLQRLRARLSEAPKDIGTVLEAIRQGFRCARSADIPWISASLGNSIKLIATEDVLFFRADEGCTWVITRLEKASIRTPLKELLPALNPDVFWQIHRSVVVRVSAICAVRRNELGRLEIALHDSAETLPVSQAFRWRFRGM
jgi:DNA-binding LytR/AlgR family response regulator